MNRKEEEEKTTRDGIWGKWVGPGVAGAVIIRATGDRRLTHAPRKRFFFTHTALQLRSVGGLRRIPYKRRASCKSLYPHFWRRDTVHRQ